MSASRPAASTSAFRVVVAYGARETIRAFNTNKTSWVGLGIFMTVVAAAILAPWLAPRDPLEQNLMFRLGMFCWWIAAGACAEPPGRPQLWRPKKFSRISGENT